VVCWQQPVLPRSSVHALVVAFGVLHVISNSPLITTACWTGVAYLLFLAWETWRSDEKEHPEIAGAASNSLFWRGFLSNVFNPKSIIFFVSVVPGFVQYGPSGSGLLLQIARLGAIYVAIATTIHASIVLLAGQLRPVLLSGSRHKRGRRMLACALVLVAACAESDRGGCNNAIAICATGPVMRPMEP
jgi:threonine/homoserine/homoserine lactone efflux protein